jgi:NitT/TauT family transport system permease protein
MAEIAGRVGIIDPQLLPVVSEVLTVAAGLAGDPDFRGDLLASVTAWGVGLLLAVAVALPLGLLLGSLPWLEAAFRPLTEFLRPIPAVAIIPLALLLFADPLEMQASVIVYAASWPILINTIYGLRDVDPVAKETLSSFGFGPVAVLWWVSLPSTAPFIATGVRMSAGIALIVTVSTELIAGGPEGIGTFITTAAGGGRNDLMLAATVWAGALGIAANAMIVGVERRLFRWHEARAGLAG